VTRAAAVVEVVVQALADNVEAVTVREVQRGEAKTIEVITGPGDLGRMIGRQGRMAAAIRTMAAIATEVDGSNVTVEFRDDLIEDG
jgi:predicted RNA-binding protein YlqC (UPF0109 family)|tara:strand:- start:732 stop:989 length:258 start_codon:yes stop_codon:yes gene_type:complete